MIRYDEFWIVFASYCTTSGLLDGTLNIDISPEAILMHRTFAGHRISVCSHAIW